MSGSASQHHSATVCKTFAARARLDAPTRPTLRGANTPDVDSDPPLWSPEQLLLSSLGLSMLTSFETLAVRDGIEVLDWKARLSGDVDEAPDGMMFTSIILELELELEFDGNTKRAYRTLEEAKQSCLVLNSLRVPVVIETKIHRHHAAHQQPHDAAPTQQLHVG